MGININHKYLCNMKRLEKRDYESPMLHLYCIEQEGVLCSSGGEVEVDDITYQHEGFGQKSTFSW